MPWCAPFFLWVSCRSAIILPCWEEGQMPITRAERDRLVRDAIADITEGHGVPRARAVRKRLSAKIKSASGRDVAAIGAAIAASPTMKAHRARWVGWELINKHEEALRTLDLAAVEALGAGNSTWDEV